MLPVSFQKVEPRSPASYEMYILSDYCWELPTDLELLSSVEWLRLQENLLRHPSVQSLVSFVNRTTDSRTEVQEILSAFAVNVSGGIPAT